MNDLPIKIGFALRTYWHSFAAIRHQYDPELIRSVQTRKLRQLIRYSAANVKYYRELFDHAGVEAEHIGTADDLYKFPITTKSELRDRFWDFLPNRLPSSRSTASCRRPPVRIGRRTAVCPGRARPVRAAAVVAPTEDGVGPEAPAAMRHCVSYHTDTSANRRRGPTSCRE